MKQYLLKNLEITAAGADVILDWGLWRRSSATSSGFIRRTVCRSAFTSKFRTSGAGVHHRKNSEVVSGAEQAYLIDEGWSRS
ncbi:MAG: hypothetical protein ACLSG5_06340 [Oscillospiraceae bacterium]